jgi:hypothetical protein
VEAAFKKKKLKRTDIMRSKIQSNFDFWIGNIIFSSGKKNIHINET